VRSLGYVNKDISNIRTMLRENMMMQDMRMTIEHFKKRQAETPNFFYATRLDEQNVVREFFGSMGGLDHCATITRDASLST
jgi:RNA binding exosome subunit